ncbi:hypothetical protein PISMIDRAFT_683859, partial [Pisolithus microcarpus 441]
KSLAEFGSSGGQQTDTFPAKPPQHLGYTGTSCNDCPYSGLRSLNPWSTAKGMTYGLLGKTLLHASNLPLKTDTSSRPSYHDGACQYPPTIRKRDTIILSSSGWAALHGGCHAGKFQ